MEETDLISPCTLHAQFLSRPVDARVKVGIGGEEGTPLPLLLWKWVRVQLVSPLFRPCDLRSFPSAVRLWLRVMENQYTRLGGGREGLEDEEAGQVVLSLSGREGGRTDRQTDGERSANPHLSLTSSRHAAALEHLLTRKY